MKKEMALMRRRSPLLHHFIFFPGCLSYFFRAAVVRPHLITLVVARNKIQTARVLRSFVG